MSGNVDHYWTTPNERTNGDFDPLQRHSYSPKNDWWHSVYIEIWGPAICHACPTVSITSKDFTRCQIVLHNPSVNVRDTVCLHPFTKITAFVIMTSSEAHFLWQYFTVCHWCCSKNGVFGKLVQCTMLILSSIHSPCIILIHMFWAIVLLTIILLLFRINMLKFSRYIVIGN